MGTGVDRDLFLEKLNALIASKREDNCFYFSQQRYCKTLAEVISAKTKCTKSLDYRRLRRFDVMYIDGEERLIAPLKPGESNIQCYVTNEELYSILHETHKRTGHAGRTRMLKVLQVNYKNITYEVVQLYLNLCKQCQIKHSAPKKSVVARRKTASSELNSKCQVDVIDVQWERDGEYKFIMVCQDHLTKFVQLRPLKTKKAEEVAHHVLSIFSTFGPPAVLESGNGREFTKKVISQICAKWKDVKITLGKACNNQTQGLVLKDIQNMLTVWMNDNNTNKWSDGLPFVQFAKNTAYHEGIRQSPYEAMFGVKTKRVMASSFLPRERIESIETGVQTEDIVVTFKTEEYFEETVDTSGKSLSSDHTENEKVEEDLESTTSSDQIVTDEHELICVKREPEEEDFPL